MLQVLVSSLEEYNGSLLRYSQRYTAQSGGSSSSSRGGASSTEPGGDGALGSLAENDTQILGRRITLPQTYTFISIGKFINCSINEGLQALTSYASVLFIKSLCFNL